MHAVAMYACLFNIATVGYLYIAIIIHCNHTAIYGYSNHKVLQLGVRPICQLQLYYYYIQLYIDACMHGIIGWTKKLSHCNSIQQCRLAMHVCIHALRNAAYLFQKRRHDPCRLQITTIAWLAWTVTVMILIVAIAINFTL